MIVNQLMPKLLAPVKPLAQVSSSLVIVNLFIPMMLLQNPMLATGHFIESQRKQ